MGFYFLTECIFTPAEIFKIRDRVKVIFFDNGPFNDFDPGKMGHGEYIHKWQLPELNLAKGVNFAKFFICGRLPSKQNSLNELLKILNKVGPILSNIEKIAINVSFEEINSIQTKRFADNISVILEKNKKEFSYEAIGSRVGRDLEYRKTFFLKLISELDLPLGLYDGENGFLLQHTEGGELFVSLCNVHKRNPSLFTCEVFYESSADLFSLLEKTLENHGSGKCFEYTWSVLIGDLMRKQDNCVDVKEGYEMLRAQNFPAQNIDINFSYYLDNVEGIETLRGLCGAKKNFLTEICSFSLPNKNSATLTANTCSEGHRLELYLSDIDCLADIEEKLGFKFIECTK